MLKRLFGQLHYGRLAVQLPDGRLLDFQGPQPGPQATIVLHRWRTLWRAVIGGVIGMADAYIDGDWSSPDLTAFIRLAARNIVHIQKVINGSRAGAFVNRLRHLRRTNSREGSRRNIEFHYDLGNEFFAAWLDRDMIYSSALYLSPEATLEEAQQTKLKRIASLLRLGGGERVLEIGCGWGALVTRLARDAGVHVTGLTLSPSQLAAARMRVQELGLSAQIDLRLEDYRDSTGAYDRVVSIEMIEAVGEAFLPAYFGAIARRLKPAGIAVLQAITIDEERFKTYRRHTDFIQKHIFPGGFLPSKTLLAEQAAKAGLRLTHSENFGQSYAATLAEWRRRFYDAWPLIAAQGFCERFRRLWTYYLCYCEAGFREGTIDVGLYVIEKF
jgi:cyclopropane-fatty-acyl-phospholipid synthase